MSFSKELLNKMSVSLNFKEETLFFNMRTLVCSCVTKDLVKKSIKRENMKAVVKTALQMMCKCLLFLHDGKLILSV